MPTTYFNQGSNLAIENLQIQHHDHHHTQSKDAFDLLQERVALGALSNSGERYDAPKCHPETRVAVQQEIVSWAEEGKGVPEPKNLLWMSGPAGTGKTAIAGSVADTCRERGLLAASFFFSSYAASASRRSKRLLIPTLAYQLLQHENLSGVREAILASIEKDPTIFNMQLKDQLQVLILNPLRAMQKRGEARGVSPKLVIIDGLDECEADLPQAEQRHKPEHRRRNESDQLEVLSALLEASLDPFFPFRILVVSRPERAILGFFRNAAQSAASEIFLDERYEPDADIALFLRSKFSEICRRYQIPPWWPGEEAIRTLVARASGQFIYAATSIRFIEDESHHPQEQLKRILGLALSSADSNPLADLDALYSHIILNSPEPRRAAAWIRCFHSLMWLEMTPRWGVPKLIPESFAVYPAVFFRQFFETRPGEAEYLLGGLRSLISLPAPDDQESSYAVWHKTLFEYLEDSAGARGAGLASLPVEWEWWAAYYRCLNGRCPPAYPDLDSASLGVFWNRFRRSEPPFRLVSRDVEERLPAVNREAISRLVQEQSSEETGDIGTLYVTLRVIGIVHENCHWSGLRCTERCKAWRRAIKSYPFAKKWRARHHGIVFLLRRFLRHLRTRARKVELTDNSLGARV